VPEYSLAVNGKRRKVVADEDTPLLWVLRDNLGLTGTKYGCGIAQCGACTVHVDGTAQKACVTPISRCAGSTIVTVEGLAPNRSHPMQRAWIAEDVPQCGYCQPGMIMAAVALVAEHPEPTDEQIIEALSHNICRCGTYQRILRAVKRAAKASGK
jgi:aerobic-type carbon monoxide dehydrogenase small subunit (CoxS/CutS family)